MEKQPVALLLAEKLEQQFPIGTAQHYLDGEAAAELRRLHAEVQYEERRFAQLSDDYAKLAKVNAQLLEALEKIDGFTMSQFRSVSDLANECQNTAYDAIAAARRNI